MFGRRPIFQGMFLGRPTQSLWRRPELQLRRHRQPLGSYGYDDNGNLASAPNGTSISWKSFDMPDTIARAGQSSQFGYGPERIAGGARQRGGQALTSRLDLNDANGDGVSGAATETISYAESVNRLS